MLCHVIPDQYEQIPCEGARTAIRAFNSAGLPSFSMVSCKSKLFEKLIPGIALPRFELHSQTSPVPCRVCTERGYPELEMIQLAHLFMRLMSCARVSSNFAEFELFASIITFCT